MDEDKRVKSIDSKSNKRNYWYENCVNAGIYILSSDILQRMEKLGKSDLENDILNVASALNGTVSGKSPAFYHNLLTLVYKNNKK